MNLDSCGQTQTGVSMGLNKHGTDIGFKSKAILYYIERVSCLHAQSYPNAVANYSDYHPQVLDDAVKTGGFH